MIGPDGFRLSKPREVDFRDQLGQGLGFEREMRLSPCNVEV